MEGFLGSFHKNPSELRIFDQGGEANHPIPPLATRPHLTSSIIIPMPICTLYVFMYSKVSFRGRSFMTSNIEGGGEGV